MILLVLVLVGRERVATSWQDRIQQSTERETGKHRDGRYAGRGEGTVIALPTTTATTTQERLYGDLAEEL